MLTPMLMRLTSTAVSGSSSSGKITFLTMSACRVSELELMTMPSCIASQPLIPASTKMT